MSEIEFERVDDQDNELPTYDTSAFVAFKLVPALTLSGAAGVVVGIIVTFFNLMLEQVAEIARYVAEAAGERMEFIPVYMLGSVAAALVMWRLIKLIPMAKGSGIPRTEAMLNNKRDVVWWKVAAGTVLGSATSFFAGLSVGMEGPSVQLGAGLARGIEKAGGRDLSARRYVSSGGAAAGLAAAFIAPLTGVLFVAEEVHRKFNPLVVACCATAVIYATLVRGLIGGALGMSSVFFDVSPAGELPMLFVWLAPLIGIVAALAAKAFNTTLLRVDSRAAASKLPGWVPLVTLFALTALANSFLKENTGSGLNAINGLLNSDYGWQDSLVLLILKCAFVLLCFRAGATGGMMIPMLAMGALLGSLCGFAGVAAGLDASYSTTVTLIAMFAFFGSCIDAPLTAIVLFWETTGADAAVPEIALAVLAASLLTKLLSQRPLYDALAERELERAAAGAKLP